MNYLKKKYALSGTGASDLFKGIIFSVLFNISLMIPVALLAYVIDYMLTVMLYSREPSVRGIGIVKITGIGIMVLLIIFILHYIQYTCVYMGTYAESAKRRITITEHLRMLPLSFFGQRDTAELTATIMGDCASFEHAFSHTVPQFWGAVISTGIVCVVMLCMNPIMGIALLWVAPIAFLIVILSKKLQRKLEIKHMQAKLDLADGIQECLENVQDIKACNGEKDYLRKLDDMIDQAENAQILSELTAASLLTTGQMFLRLGLATVIVVGSNLVAGSDISLFTYVLYLIAASRIYDPLSGAMKNMSELFQVDLQITRLNDIMNYPLQTGKSVFEGKDYTVQFEHVKFSYEEGKDVLKDVTFQAKQGQVTALVGPSGGGKSTALKLVTRFHDITGGKITIGGQNILNISPDELMKNFSIVFQEVVLFQNTVMENIRMGRQSATDEEVIQAAIMANCDEFIMRMPEGYHTMVGENGATLSGGECQRISIARALLKDAPIICLDEATASLDVDSEAQVQKAISRLIQGKTVLIIAHRMRTVEAADQIVVLKDGIVTEQGNHEHLMKNKGFYKKMVDLQTKSLNWQLNH